MKTETVLAPVRPNYELELVYRRRLVRLLDEMHRSLEHWLAIAYRRHVPAVARLAQDENAATALRTVVRRLTRRWQRRFNEMAAELARYFATQAAQRSDAALKSTLRRGGFAVEFSQGPAVRETIGATLHENVGLIRSIAQQHLTQVETLVMRSVTQGRDLAFLSEGLQKQFGVSKRRAAFIARDQNNKATANLQRARHLELGIVENVWVHSTAGKTPRPSHVKAGRDRQRYSVADGWFDPHEKQHVWPGTLINCRCVGRPVLPLAPAPK